MGASTSCQPIFPSLFATISTGPANDIIVNICTDNACSVDCNTIQTTISGCAPLPGVVNHTLSITPISYVNACKVPDQHLSKSSIAAIVVGSIAGLALLIGVVVYACKARRSGYAAISDYWEEMSGLMTDPYVWCMYRACRVYELWLWSKMAVLLCWITIYKIKQQRCSSVSNFRRRA